MRKARRTACMPMEVAPIIVTSSPIFHADEVSATSITFSLLSAEEQCPLTLQVEQESRCLDDPHKNLRTTYVFHNTLMSYYISHFANCTLQIAANLSISLKITKYLNVFYSAI